ncbi:histidine kinase [Leptospira perolatii]|uniref:histidine kinase n=1 Tax=Leptospira perolatii TaxID=2023191 RepID=A0A2M9ZQR5_9LEPT|nr:PAS domain S-box protein [Leptospira perolatii]PJZ70539.1 histidine kinase [Leptospira perolatii]PJZ74375.1 histidine kinase [Leptospira perolatii]
MLERNRKVEQSLFPSWCILADENGNILQTNCPLERWEGTNLSDYFIGTEFISNPTSNGHVFEWRKDKNPSSCPQPTLRVSCHSVGGLRWIELFPADSENSESEFSNILDSSSYLRGLSFRQIFETNQAIKWILDPDTGNILFVNEAACSFYGYSKEELLQMKVSDINCLSKEEIFKEMRHAANESRLYYLFKHRLKSGEIRDVEVYTGPFKMAGKTLLFSIIHDVTERIIAKKKLETSEERYRSLFENASDAIIIVNRSGELLDLNRTAVRLLGYSREEFIHLKLTDIQAETCRERVAQDLSNVQLGKPVLLECILVSKEGRSIGVEVNAVLLEDGTIMGIARDTTERSQMMSRLENSLKEKEVMLQEIHHRVKNNLQVVSSLLELQYDNSDNPELRKVLKDSASRVKSMAYVHEELYRSVNLAEVDLREYFELLTENLMHVYGAEQNIKIRLDVDAISVSIEKAIPLGLLLNELLTNSLKYAFPDHKGGRIKIGLSSDGKEMRFSYKDDGIGFALEKPIREGSIGVQLLEIFSKQLRATVVQKTDSGVLYELRIPLSF